MDEAEFDRFADEYRSLHTTNIAVSGETPEYFAEYKIRDIATQWTTLRHNNKLDILDFGSGIGNSVPFIIKYFPQSNITCLDVSAKSLAIGQGRFGDQARFLSFDGMKLPLPDASMDIVLAACVFHHIDPSEHVNLLREFHRILRIDGFAFVFEHNPLNPLTRRAVNTCPFDENAKLIYAPVMRNRLLSAGFKETQVRYRIFFPRALKALRSLEKWMTRLPCGAQYYALAKK